MGKEFAVPGEFEAGHSDEEKGKLSAVHFVRFVFPPDAIRAFAEAPSTSWSTIRPSLPLQATISA